MSNVQTRDKVHRACSRVSVRRFRYLEYRYDDVGRRPPGRHIRTPYSYSWRCSASEEGVGAAAKLPSAMQDEGRESGLSAFGALLRRYRLAAGLSQGALAERARLSLHGISALERGFRRTPQRETVALLAGALALSDEQRRTLEAAATRAALPRRRGETSVTIGPWASAGNANLPPALTSFVGRAAELDQIAALVCDHRLVTLTGAGGVGKTQTACHVGRALSDAYGTAIAFASLASIGDPSLVVTAIASALGVKEVPRHEPLATVIAFLKNKTLLLILDNCEHVIAQAAGVTESLLAGCPCVRILATSREPLRTAGEYAYRLPSLNVKDAIALFADRACAANNNFAITDDDAPIVAELCRRLDGIPLAVELAAARVSLLSLKALAEKLDDRFRILTGGERTALPRLQTMRATIDWSYDLLAAPEQLLFERLSVFAGGCALAAATAVCAGGDVSEADVFGLLSALVNKSLVVPDLDGNEPRYRLLESFRQYARERLAMRGEERTTAHRHAFACLELAQAIHRMKGSRLERERRALPEADNFRAALRWALAARGDILLGQRIASELRGASLVFTNTEGQRWIAVALELVDGQTPTSLVAALRLAMGYIANTLREYKLELTSGQEALVHYHLLGDTVGIAQSQAFVSRALLCLGRRAEAQALLDEALPGARGLAGRDRLALAMILRLIALATEGDAIAARPYIAEAIQIIESLGEKALAAAALIDLSVCEFDAGNLEQALRHVSEALAAARICERPDVTCLALDMMSVYLIGLARYEEAKKSAREALDIACEYDLDVYAADALEHLAAVATLRSEIATEPEPRAYAKATRILGFTDACVRASGSARSAFEQYHQTLSALRRAMGPEVVASLIAEGAAMTQEQAIDEAMAL
jgi:predicted ATPase/transcriptional regulator with XRE-family HTH domain